MDQSLQACEIHRHLNENNKFLTSLRVIVIPAVREYLAPKLTEEDFSWLQNPGVAASDVQNVAAFIFDHGITADKNFDWRDLFDKAADFLDDLMGLEEIDEVRRSW